MIKVAYVLPEDYPELRNSLFLLARKWEVPLLGTFPKLQELQFIFRIVPRHVIPFSTKPLLRLELLSDETALAFTILTHRKVPDEIVLNIIAAELQKRLVNTAF